MQITLHLGAHKTASTHLQNVLEDRADALESAAISYIPLGELRGQLSHPLWQIRNREDTEAAAATAQAYLSGRAQGAARLILSDENFLGLALKPDEPNRFYPEAEANLSALMAVIGRPERIYLSLRSIDGFLASAYLERLRHHPFHEFETFLGETQPDRLLWSNLIRRLGGLIGAPMTVWRFEDYRALGPEVLRAMTGLALEADGRDIRPSLSAAGVEALRDLAAAGEVTPGEKTIQRLLNDFPRGETWPAFDPWTPEMRARLRARYDEDIAHLADTDGLTFLRP